MRLSPSLKVLTNRTQAFQIPLLKSFLTDDKRSIVLGFAFELGSSGLTYEFIIGSSQCIVWDHSHCLTASYHQDRGSY